MTATGTVDPIARAVALTHSFIEGLPDSAPLFLQPDGLEALRVLRDCDPATYLLQLGAIRQRTPRHVSETIYRQVGPPKNGARVAPEIFNAAQLAGEEFKAVKYLVDGLIPEGAFLLAGRPKIGKSWLAIDIALSVAMGDHCLGRETAGGDVLLLPLEDTRRRLHSRLALLRVRQSWPASLQCALHWPRIDEGGADELAKWCDKVKAPKLIVVDTLAKIRPPRQRNEDPYASDYAVGAALKQVSDSRPGLTVIAVTHLRKAEADDPIDKITGTLGLSGAFDGAMVLDRKRNESTGVLKIVGRDIEHDVDLGVEWAPELTRWRIIGDAAEVKASAARRQILACIREAKEAMLPREIAEETGLPRGSVRHLVRKMHGDGLLVRHEGTGRNHRYGVRT